MKFVLLGSDYTATNDQSTVISIRAIVEYDTLEQAIEDLNKVNWIYVSDTYAFKVNSIVNYDFFDKIENNNVS